MKRNPIALLLLLPVLFNCKNDKLNDASSHSIINTKGETVQQRIAPPDGFKRVEEKTGSFGYFIQNLPLKPAGSPVLDYMGNKIYNQDSHVAVVDYDIGSKDLQQCADAVIRVHAEYLFHNQKEDKIEYHFTNGDLYRWIDYKAGYRPILINNNTIDFQKSAPQTQGYDSFRKYLDHIFMYAGTISLNKETRPVASNDAIKTGDILITPGSPGHVVFIAGHAKNKNGKSVYLLAEGYTPAQSIHVVNNPYNKTISPWYELDISATNTQTARYSFNGANIRSFVD